MARPAAGGTEPAWIVAADPVERAAECLVERMRALAAPAGELRLAISGGSALAVALRAAEWLGGDWRRVTLTWVDERCVPLADPASNRGEAVRRGLLRVPPARIVPLYEDDESPEAAVVRYTQRWRTELRGALDLALLGLGEDGHVASLFPSRAWRAEGIAFHIADAPKPPASRISLTRAALASARHTLVFATGESKRPALLRLRAKDATLPATGLPGLVVVTDQA